MLSNIQYNVPNINHLIINKKRTIIKYCCEVCGCEASREHCIKINSKYICLNCNREGISEDKFKRIVPKGNNTLECAYCLKRKHIAHFMAQKKEGGDNKAHFYRDCDECRYIKSRELSHKNKSSVYRSLIKQIYTHGGGENRILTEIPCKRLTGDIITIIEENSFVDSEPAKIIIDPFQVVPYKTAFTSVATQVSPIYNRQPLSSILNTRSPTVVNNLKPQVPPLNLNSSNVIIPKSFSIKENTKPEDKKIFPNTNQVCMALMNNSTSSLKRERRDSIEAGNKKKIPIMCKPPQTVTKSIEYELTYDENMKLLPKQLFNLFSLGRCDKIIIYSSCKTNLRTIIPDEQILKILISEQLSIFYQDFTEVMTCRFCKRQIVKRFCYDYKNDYVCRYCALKINRSLLSDPQCASKCLSCSCSSCKKKKCYHKFLIFNQNKYLERVEICNICRLDLQLKSV